MSSINAINSLSNATPLLRQTSQKVIKKNVEPQVLKDDESSQQKREATVFDIMQRMYAKNA